MVISIRRSRHEEGEELVAIWCRSVDATHDFLSAEYRTELEDLVRSFLPEAPLWVAVNERDQPVGFMLLSGQHMDALFIDPDVRGCGVGRVLVEHALSMAPELTFINVAPATTSWRMRSSTCDKPPSFISSALTTISIRFAGKKECQVERGWSCRTRSCRTFSATKKLAINRRWLLKAASPDTSRLLSRSRTVI